MDLRDWAETGGLGKLAGAVRAAGAVVQELRGGESGDGRTREPQGEEWSVGAAALTPEGDVHKPLPRAGVAAVLAMTVAGVTLPEQAAELGWTELQVRRVQYVLRKQGRLALEHLSLLENWIVPEAVQQIRKGVEAGDKDYVLAVARGRGLLVQHQAVRHEGSPRAMVLAVRMDGAGAQGPVPGEVLGTPRTRLEPPAGAIAKVEV